MKRVRIPGITFETSRFIFGTASLFNAGDHGVRQRLLHAAAEAGFSHFDTAPYYGFGVAERDLAPILKVYPDVTFTTKVGLYSPGGENQPDFMVFARKAAGRFLKVASRPASDFHLNRAQISLTQSLKRTGREQVDIFMLHEPKIDDLNRDEWLRWLEDSVVSGKVRHFGVALTAGQLKPFLAAKSPLADIVQVVDSLERREADVLTDYARHMQITYGYVSSALKSDPAVDAGEVLKQALQRNANGAIIVSSRRIERLGLYARLAGEI